MKYLYTKLRLYFKIYSRKWYEKRVIYCLIRNDMYLKEANFIKIC